MKIAVIGHLCFDVFHRKDSDGDRVVGGIYHSIATMAYLASGTDSIIPIVCVGEKDYDWLVQKLSALPSVDTSAVFKFSGETNTVHYYEDGRGEESLHISAPIPFGHIKKYLNVDGVYINMISGSDLSVDALDEIRLAIRPKKIPIHLDMHCLTLHVNDDGTRFRRPMSDWRRWCFMIDSIQMNEDEAKDISIEKFSNELLAKQMIPLMVRAFLITRGKKGVTLYKADHKFVIQKEFTGETVEDPVSVIGSGDIFGASYFTVYLKKKNFEEAIQFGVKAASLTTHYGMDDKHRHLMDMGEGA